MRHVRKIASALGIALFASIAAAQPANLRTDIDVAVHGVGSDAARVKPCPSIDAYGGSTGSADNGPALVAALTASSGDGHCVSFPPGRFTFASAVNFRLPDGSASSSWRPDRP